MKKVLAFVLVLALSLSMAISAAADSVPETDLSDTLPQLTDTFHDNVTLHHIEGIGNLHKEGQEEMGAAEEDLPDAHPAGYILRHFFYVELHDSEHPGYVEFEDLDGEGIIFMEYVDGKWVELTHTVDDNGIVTVPVHEEGCLAIFVTSIESPGAKRSLLVPDLTEHDDELAEIYSAEEVMEMSQEIQAQMAAAKEALGNARPEGFAAKYFCYLDLHDMTPPADVDLAPIDHEEIQFKQFVDGAWVDVHFSVAEDGVITLEDAVNGPLAVFTK